MNNPDPVFENILQAERLKMNSLVRALTFMRLERTSEYARGKADVTGLQYKEFKPSLMIKLFFIVPFFLFAIFTTIFQAPNEVLFLMLIQIAILAIIIVIIYYANKGKAYAIRMDYDSLTVGDKNYRWKDIYDTAILIRGKGKHRRVYFVVAYNDKLNYDVYKLHNFTSFSFTGFSRTLAKHIEAFKPGGK